MQNLTDRLRLMASVSRIHVQDELADLLEEAARAIEDAAPAIDYLKRAKEEAEERKKFYQQNPY